MYYKILKLIGVSFVKIGLYVSSLNACNSYWINNTSYTYIYVRFFVYKLNIGLSLVVVIKYLCNRLWFYNQMFFNLS